MIRRNRGNVFGANGNLGSGRIQAGQQGTFTQTPAPTTAAPMTPSVGFTNPHHAQANTTTQFGRSMNTAPVFGGRSNAIRRR